MKKLPPDFQILVTPLGLILVLLILIWIIFNVGISRISSQNEQLATTQKNENILSQRLSVLQQISATVTPEAQAADAALPDTNAGLLALSQLRQLSGKSGVTVVDFTIGSEQGSLTGLSRVDVNITVDGSFASVISFISQLNSIAPIVVPQKIRITSAGASSRGVVTVSTYFAPLPTTIPALTQPVTQLTASETDLVLKISALTQPTFLKLIPQSPSSRPNPF